MAIVKMELDVAKESKDVMDLLVVLVKDIRAKKTIAEISADALPKLMGAIDGVNQIPDEVKDRKVVMATAGYSLGEIVDGLIG